MLHVFLYISELFISVIGIILKVIKEVAEEFLFSSKADTAETTSLGAPLCLHYGESKFSLYAGSPSCLRSTFCAATPLLNSKPLCHV